MDVQWNIVKLNDEGILPGQTPQGFMIATKKETTSTIGIVPETSLQGTLGCQFQSSLTNEKAKMRQSLYEAVFFLPQLSFFLVAQKIAGRGFGNRDGFL